MSLPNDEIRKLKDFQEKVFDAVAEQVEAWGIEKNEKGWMAKYYLYCNETTCPYCKTQVPMAPSWWVSKRTNTVALLHYNKTKHNFDIDIVQSATKEQIEACERSSTVRDGSLWCPKCQNATPITVLRRDDIDNDGNPIYGLRKWGEKEFLPRPEDVFQERLYAIKYLEKNDKKTWGQFLKKPAPATDATYGTVYYVVPDENDLKREQKVVDLLTERFDEWQTKGYIPASKIEPGDETSRLQRERGWQYWHQLFNPRQLLQNGLFAEILDSLKEDKNELVLGMLGLNRIADFNSKLCRWHSRNTQIAQTFYNQALNTLDNYAAKGMSAQYIIWKIELEKLLDTHTRTVKLFDARITKEFSDIWITDPPYADAVNYHELTEFFLAWDKQLIEKTFSSWYTESKRVLAVKGVMSTILCKFFFSDLLKEGQICIHLSQRS